MVIKQFNLLLQDMGMIAFQLQNSACKIFDTKNKFFGLGFLIKLKINNNDSFFFMINNKIKEKKYCYILLNDKSQGKNNKKILIDNSFSINYKEMISFIDMNKFNINKKKFLELDEKCISTDMTSNETIYIPNSNGKGDINIIYGFLNGIEDINNNPKNKNNDYFPILSLKSKRILGLYYKNNNNKEISDFKFPIKELNEQINKVNNKMYKEILLLIYNITDKNKIKLFGKQFVTNNKNNIRLIINNKELELIEYLDLKNIPKEIINKGIIKIRLKKTRTITNISYMFSETSISPLTDVSKWNTTNIINMSYLFEGCSSLTNLPDIINWNTKNVINMEGMFLNCTSLITLPEISKWNMEKVTNISKMFSNCEKLEHLPNNISKWNTKKITDISQMFLNCLNLKYLPEISEWSTNNVTNMSQIFSNCKALISLPNISIWKMNNVTNMSQMFSNCKLLKTLPDISEWITTKVYDISGLFSDCISLREIPDISKWDLSNVINFSYLFDNCILSKNFPDLSQLNQNHSIYNSSEMNSRDVSVKYEDYFNYCINNKDNSSKSTSSNDDHNKNCQIVNIENYNLNNRIIDNKSSSSPENSKKQIIYDVCKSICKIVASNQVGTGFLIN